MLGRIYKSEEDVAHIMIKFGWHAFEVASKYERVLMMARSDLQKIYHARWMFNVCHTKNHRLNLTE